MPNPRELPKTAERGAKVLRYTNARGLRSWRYIVWSNGKSERGEDFPTKKRARQNALEALARLDAAQ